MSCVVCSSHHPSTGICDRLRDAANSLELFAVPAFLTDPCNRIVWVNREFAAQVGDPVADGVSWEDRFLPALLLGPYRDRFPRARAEVAQCIGALTPEVEAGSLSLPTRRLVSRVLKLYHEELASEVDREWDGTIVIRPVGCAMRLAREQVIPLADVHGLANGFHISVWTPTEGRYRSVDAFDLRTATILTRRQMEVALMYASGMTTRAVAERVGVTHRTARDHVEAAFERLGVHSRTELQAALGRQRRHSTLR